MMNEDILSGLERNPLHSHQMSADQTEQHKLIFMRTFLEQKKMDFTTNKTDIHLE